MKELIEKEGFKLDVFNDGIYISFTEDTNILHIYDHNGDTFYFGKCKDINTFRFLIKTLEL